MTQAPAIMGFGDGSGDDLSLGDEIDVVDDLQGLLHVMGDHDGTRPQGVVELANQLADD
jgi:hypothetical protein